jgi:hypothetical protein
MRTAVVLLNARLIGGVMFLRPVGVVMRSGSRDIHVRLRGARAG